MEKVTVICTTKNESSNIAKLVNSLINQTQKPDEIIFVDAISTDETLKILNSFAKKYTFIKVFESDLNRSQGRNLAINKARNPIIAITDAGCIPEPDWLNHITAPFLDKKVSYVSGFYKGLSKNIFEKCLIPYVLVMPDRARSDFTPSSRSMSIRKNVWSSLGGQREDLNTSEDFEFAHRLVANGYKGLFVKNAVVSWFPKKDLKEAIWMFINFSCSDILAGILRPKVKMLLVRYSIGIFIFFFILELNKIATIYYLLAIITLYSIWAIIKNYKYIKDLRAFFWLPLLQVTSDISVIFGTLVGIMYKISSK